MRFKAMKAFSEVTHLQYLPKMILFICVDQVCIRLTNLSLGAEEVSLT